jgi:hypothetical protein
MDRIGATGTGSDSLQRVTRGDLRVAPAILERRDAARHRQARPRPFGFQDVQPRPIDRFEREDRLKAFD